MLLETQCAAMSVNERLEYSDNHAPCYHTIARRTRSCGCSARSSPSKVTPMLISVRVLRHIYVSSKVRREHTDNADDGIPVVAESHDTHARRRPVITRCIRHESASKCPPKRDRPAAQVWLKTPPIFQACYFLRKCVLRKIVKTKNVRAALFVF